MFSDVKLTQVISTTGENYYDINFTDGDFTLTHGLITAFMITIFCEQRDDGIEVPQKRGGWAGNQLQPIEGFQQGSLIWTLYQSIASEEIVIQAQNLIENAFQWFIDDGIAKDIEVEVFLIANNKLQVKITATRNDNTEIVEFFDLWINTINNN